MKFTTTKILSNLQEDWTASNTVFQFESVLERSGLQQFLKLLMCSISEMVEFIKASQFKPQNFEN